MKNTSKIDELIDHFFRHESGKLISVLTGILGSNNLILAEDIVQDALVEAISNWTYKGIPENPIAWLYTVAKNKTLNVINREKHLEKYISENIALIKAQESMELNLTHLFSKDNISDDQLLMMFMCCHPSISKDSQIALMLKTLCGFSIGEIAKSFLTTNENINKRLVRSRKTIRQNNITFEVPSQEQLENRLEAVLEAIYLLFNEGYSASTGTKLIRTELCKESVRLAEIVIEHKSILNTSNAYALLALMQLNTSRFKAREDKQGNIITLSQQDRSLWDLHIMEKGFSNLEKAAQNEQISKYHILASISAYHCSSRNFASTDWESILILYNKLLLIDNSPIVILNRAIVLSKVGNCTMALEELDSITDNGAIKRNYLFYSAKAEILAQSKDYQMAKESLNKAMELAPLESEKKMLKQRFAAYFEKKEG